MSNRTLLEINHDQTGRIKKDPEGFIEALTLYLSSGSHVSAIDLRQFGIRVFGMRHHSEGFKIRWGAHDVGEKP